MNPPTSIQAHFGDDYAQIIATAGEGDSKVTLWRSSGGRQAIETVGDPILDTDPAGFRAAVTFWPGFEVREQPEGDRWELLRVIAKPDARPPAPVPDLLAALQTAHKLILEMGHTIHALDPAGAHCEYWTVDGKYLPNPEYNSIAQALFAAGVNVADQWGEQFEADAKAGKLDFVLPELVADDATLCGSNPQYRFIDGHPVPFTCTLQCYFDDDGEWRTVDPRQHPERCAAWLRQHRPGAPVERLLFSRDHFAYAGAPPAPDAGYYVLVDVHGYGMSFGPGDSLRDREGRQDDDPDRFATEAEAKAKARWAGGDFSLYWVAPGQTWRRVTAADDVKEEPA